MLFNIKPLIPPYLLLIIGSSFPVVAQAQAQTQAQAQMQKQRHPQTQMQEAQVQPQAQTQVQPQAQAQAQAVNSSPVQISSVAQKPTGESMLQKKLRHALRKSGIPSNRLGLVTAGPAHTLYELNASKDFIPASLIKIFTASALLNLLSLSLQFNTRFMALNQVRNSILKGDLYLKGGGDPGFVSESLWNLINNLTRTGLKTVEGNLIVDDSRFDTKRRGPRLPQPSHASYDSPVGALSFNWNTANIYARPGKRPGVPLTIRIDPSPSYFLKIKNKTLTVKLGHKKSILVQRTNHPASLRESLTIQGQMRAQKPEVLIYKNILYPAMWTGWNAVEFLKQRGIRITGTVQRGHTPPSALTLAEWQGKPLVELIKSMMKYSNNFMVEMLIKNLTVELKNKTGNLKDGLHIIKKHISGLGITAEEYHLEQASGLSRNNKIKPAQALNVLEYWRNHPLQPEWESALPLSGEDGTLQKYFKGPRARILKGRVHAKTGSINGVTGLAGYIITKTGEKRTFVFLFNGPTTLQSKANKLFEQWAYIIYAY